MKKIVLRDYQSKSDILFKDFQEFSKIQEEMGIDDITSMDEQFLQNRLLKIFYNINPSDQRLLQQSQIELLVNKLLVVISQPKSEFKNIIIIGDKKYGFIPNFEKITSGELIDLDSYLLDKNYIGIISILYRPIIGDINKKGEYRIEEYKGDNSKEFEFLTLDIVEGCIELFTNSYQTLKATIQNSMVDHQMMEKKAS